MKKYIKLNPNTHGYTHIKIETYYKLGGYNYFTHDNEPRGYYISVVPVTRENRDGIALETITAFTGLRSLLLEVTRKSAKAEYNADQIATAKEEWYIKRVCSTLGLEVVTPC